MAPLSQLGLLASLAAVLSCSLAAALNAPKIHARVLDGPEALNKSYDYVIIGGGTAGLTVGDRLSEDGKTTVLVIENGELANSDEINNVRDRVSWNAEPWWLYNITSAPNKELENLESTVYIANVVGGSSALNGMQCVRGTTDDYDRWGSFFGNGSTWSWNGILPYFKKGLHFQPPSEEAVDQMPGIKYDEFYWGTTSRLYAGWPSFQWPGIKYQFEVFTELPGVEVPKDSGAGQTGVYWYPTFMDAEGSVNRSYARTGHWDNLNRANYDLITESKVTKIELDGNKATGVVFRPSEVDGEGVEFTTVKANKEVILSAGTIHSPQLLQLSGIGPRKLLESAGIEPKVELPGVGQNFHDHTTLHFEIKFRNYSIHPNRRDDFEDPDFIAWADELWDANRTGPWSRALWNTGAWLGLPVVAPEAYESIAAKVDAQNAADYLPTSSDPTVIAGYQARLASLAEAIRSSDNIFYSHYFSGDEPVNYFTYEHPLSLGTVNINISAPESEPIVDYRTYSNPVDFDIMLELARFHRRINVESPLLAQFDPVETSPGLNVTSREDWVAYMRHNTEPTAMHPTGTCAMMPLELGGVVDEQLRVYGVKGLRVVDASVMSVIVGVNLAGTVFAIAEKGADLIKNGSE
ncbi:GMC oxidoreductase [Zopfia rhizophila CBS 207.26]|uniref:GMC oxidoreductase n=1 Tax=Zopfia rhizophila CBS 207.26 TaxID=1314779 RepID=A0A6A6EWD9_9PEZI|nr:GMC oxidoreductase [Zopfia rhizophila CBS 207.26]